MEDVFWSGSSEEIGAGMPSGECLNWEAYSYVSDTYCDNVWNEWDTACSFWWTAECTAAEEAMYDAVGYLQLAKSTSESSHAYDFLIGTSVGAVVTLGALFAIRQCSGKRDGDFERV